MTDGKSTSRPVIENGVTDQPTPTEENGDASIVEKQQSEQPRNDGEVSTMTTAAAEDEKKIEEDENEPSSSALTDSKTEQEVDDGEASVPKTNQPQPQQQQEMETNQPQQQQGNSQAPSPAAQQQQQQQGTTPAVVNNQMQQPQQQQQQPQQQQPQEQQAMMTAPSNMPPHGPMMGNPAMAGAGGPPMFYPPHPASNMMGPPAAAAGFFPGMPHPGMMMAAAAQNAHAMYAMQMQQAQAAAAMNNNMMQQAAHMMGNQQMQAANHFQQQQQQKQLQQQQPSPFPVPSSTKKESTPTASSKNSNGGKRKFDDTTSSSTTVQSSSDVVGGSGTAAATTGTLPPPLVSSTSASNSINSNSNKELQEEQRERNREHARSTRLRKKAYIQKLKELVEGCSTQRTEEVINRKMAIQQYTQTQESRKFCLRQFLLYHASFETDKRKWSELLEPNFCLTQPITPYRCFRRNEIVDDCRVSRGVDAIIADAASIAVMIEGLGSKTNRWMQLRRQNFIRSNNNNKNKRKAATGAAAASSVQQQNNSPKAVYHVNNDDMMITGDVIMFSFVFRTQDAIGRGALDECVSPGMLRGQFSPHSNKLINMEMTYDAFSFMQQLEHACGSDDISTRIIPSSLDVALSPNLGEARSITIARPPYSLVNVNETWTELFKYTQNEVHGQNLFLLLEGGSGGRDQQWNDDDTRLQSTNDNVPYDSLEFVSEGRCTCTTRCHYDQTGRKVIDFISSYPLTNENDEVTHILHVHQDLDPLPAESVIAPTASNSIKDDNKNEEVNEQKPKDSSG